MHAFLSSTRCAFAFFAGASNTDAHTALPPTMKTSGPPAVGGGFGNDTCCCTVNCARVDWRLTLTPPGGSGMRAGAAVHLTFNRDG